MNPRTKQSFWEPLVDWTVRVLGGDIGVDSRQAHKSGIHRSRKIFTQDFRLVRSRWFSKIFIEKRFFPTVLAKRCAYNPQGKRNCSTQRLRGLRNSEKKIAGGVHWPWAGSCGPDWDRCVGPGPAPFFFVLRAQGVALRAVRTPFVDQHCL